MRSVLRCEPPPVRVEPALPLHAHWDDRKTLIVRPRPNGRPASTTRSRSTDSSAQQVAEPQRFAFDAQPLRLSWLTLSRRQRGARTASSTRSSACRSSRRRPPRRARWSATTASASRCASGLPARTTQRRREPNRASLRRARAPGAADALHARLQGLVAGRRRRAVPPRSEGAGLHHARRRSRSRAGCRLPATRCRPSAPSCACR